MLNKVLRYLNNYFMNTKLVQTGTGFIYDRQYEYNKEISFTATDTINGDFEGTYIAGEYVRIQGSRINDGVYKVSANNNTSLTIDTDIKAVKTEGAVSVLISKCYIPDELIDLVSDISSWVDNNSVDGVASESIDDYSITYDSNTSSGGWQGAFQGKLSQYKKLRW